MKTLVTGATNEATKESGTKGTFVLSKFPSKRLLASEQNLRKIVLTVLLLLERKSHDTKTDKESVGKFGGQLSRVKDGPLDKVKDRLQPVGISQTVNIW